MEARKVEPATWWPESNRPSGVVSVAVWSLGPSNDHCTPLLIPTVVDDGENAKSRTVTVRWTLPTDPSQTADPPGPPIASNTWTANEWGPSASPAYVTGATHDWAGPPSRLHLNVAGVSLGGNSNVADVASVTPGGPTVMSTDAGGSVMPGGGGRQSCRSRPRRAASVSAMEGSAARF